MPAVICYPERFIVKNRALHFLWKILCSEENFYRMMESMDFFTEQTTSSKTDSQTTGGTPVSINDAA